MKRIFASLSIFLAICAAAQVQTDVNSLRVYINPGHGSWGPGDRPQCVYIEENGSPVLHDPGTAVGTTTPQYPDTLAFYESNTNLPKCFGVLEYLRQMGLQFDPTRNQAPASALSGKSLAEQTKYIATNDFGAARDLTQNIVMSRVKNGPLPYTGNGDSSGTSVCNRDLSVIAREAQDNNFDIFLAVHSNGGTDGTNQNYTLLLYRGYTNPTTEHSGLTRTHQEMSRNMGLAIWPHIFNLPYQKWTNTSLQVTGDCNFYPQKDLGTAYDCFGYLGALKSRVVGILTEGYFHTYQPSRHRAMNWDVDRIEGILYGRGIADYLGIPHTHKGNIYGIVRDQSRTISLSYFTPNSSTNDKYYPVNGATVQLYNSEGQLIDTKTTDRYYNGAFVFLDLEPDLYTIRVTHPSFGSYTKDLIVEADKETLPEIFLPAIGNDILERSNIVPAGSYTLTTAFSERNISQLTGYTVKRAVSNGDLTYILGHSDSDSSPKVVVYNHAIQAVVATPDISACVGDISPLADIAVTSDGVLIGVNATQQNNHSTCSMTPLHEITLYKWANDATGVPTGSALVMGQSASGESYRAAAFYHAIVGESLAYSGSSQSGKAYILAKNNYGPYHNDGTSDAIRIICATVSGGSVSSFIHDRLNTLSGAPAPSTFGDIVLEASTTAGNYIVNGSLHAPMEFRMPGTTNTAPSAVSTLRTGMVGDAAISVAPFAFLSRRYMAVPTTTGVDLLDITSGLASASQISLTGNTIGASAALGAVHVTAIDRSTIDEAQFSLIAVRGNSITRFNSNSLRAGEYTPPTLSPDPRPLDLLAPYAYDLKIENGNALAGYTLSYRLNNNAASATVILHNTLTGEDTELDAPAAKGLNTLRIPAAIFEAEGDFTWSVRAVGTPVTEARRIWHESPTKSVRMVYSSAWEQRLCRGGLQVVNDHNSSRNGYIVTSQGFGQGFRVLSPELQGVGDNGTTRRFYTWSGKFKEDFLGSPYTLAQRDGKIYASDFSDNYTDIFVYDPENPETAPGSFLPSGTTRASNGKLTFNGNMVGCSSSGIAFTGSGADTRFWLVAEDYSPANQLVYYNVGTAATNSTAPINGPSTVNSTNLMSSTTPTLCPASRGLFVAQPTAVNTADKPAFVFVGHDNTIKFNSSSITGLGGCLGSVALNADESLLAIAVPLDGIRIYNVSWSAQDVPSFTLNHTIASSTNYDESVWQMAFDPAGNLYAYFESPARINAGLNVFSVLNSNPVSLMQAPDSQMLSGSTAAAALVPFAYNLGLTERADGKYELSYTLTDAAESVDINIFDEATGDSFTLQGSADAGANSLVVSPSQLLTNGVYNWSVSVNGFAANGDGRIFHEAPEIYKFQATAAMRRTHGGVQVIDDPNSPYFGHVVTSQGFAQGFRVLRPTDFSNIYTGNITTSASDTHTFKDDNYASPGTLAQRGGQIIAVDFTDSKSNIWTFDPVTTAIYTLMPEDATRNVKNGMWTTSDGNMVACSSLAAAFTGEGDDTRLWYHAEDFSPADALVYYNIGTSDTNTTAPVATGLSGTNLLLNAQTALSITPTTHSGVFVAQGNTIGDGSNKTTSITNTASCPAFVFVDNAGTVRYNSSVLSDLTGCSGAVAVNRDENLLAVAVPNVGIRIYELTWSGNTPSLQFLYTVNDSNNSTDVVCQMTFDRAGNLYAYYSSTEQSLSGLHVFALRHSASSITSPAADNLVLRGEVEHVVQFFGNGERGEYAYNISGVQNEDDGLYYVTFTLTGPAPKVVIQPFNLATQQNSSTFYDLYDLDAGTHTLAIDPAELPGNRQFIWNVYVYNPAVRATKQLRFDPVPAQDTRGGVVVIQDYNSPKFGHVVTSTARGNGFRVYDPTDALSADAAAPDYNDNLAAGISWTSTSRNSPYHLAELKGKVYAADWALESSNLLIFDPANPTAEITSALSGSRNSSGHWSYSGTKYFGCPKSIAFTRYGSDYTLWTYVDGMSAGGGETLVRYKLDSDGKVIPSSAEVLSSDFDFISGTNGHGSGRYFYIEVVGLTPGLNGIFAAQRVETNSAAHPGFLYIDGNGAVVLDSSVDHPDHIGGGVSVALNYDKSLAAIAQGDGTIAFYRVTWSSTGIPTLTRIPGLTVGDQSAAEHAEYCQMAFDPAGNLHVFRHHKNNYTTVNGYHVYALATADLHPGAAAAPRRAQAELDLSGPLSISPAPLAYTIQGKSATTGVEDVEIDALPADDDAPETWYTLQGHRVDPRNLAPGIYIRRLGTTATKVRIP